jgi:hypothetical protein
VRDVTSFSAQANSADGQTTAALGGAVTFDKGSKPFAMQFVKVNGQWKVKEVQFDPGNNLPKKMKPPATGE